jgi:uncharacterized hydrophobic protein (TIGR00271 family)
VTEATGNLPPIWTVRDEIERLTAESDHDLSGVFLVHQIPHADRAGVLQRVFLDADDRWFAPFLVMTLLSAGVATLGLSQDSAATVIGSMIIAPLASPITGLGGALALGWPRETVRMLGAVLFGSLCVVATAFAIGFALPDGTPTAQILARTNPDLRDLGVAVFAGAAGAYALTRPSLSSSLVGVAIAVALVPPLGVIGLMLQQHHWVLARGAVTLFAANFVGITVSAASVLLITGFVPLPKIRSRSKAVICGLAGIALLVIAVAIPLALTYRSAMAAAREQTSVYKQAAATIGQTNTGVDLQNVRIAGQTVTITVSDAAAAPTAEAFAKALVDELGPNVKVIVQDASNN